MSDRLAQIRYELSSMGCASVKSGLYLLAEVARLTVALEEIRDYPPTATNTETLFSLTGLFKEIARAALAGTGEEQG